MRRVSLGCLRVAAVMCLLALPAVIQAQGTSGIAGVVKDTSGAVLPGVTVEATSPVLIEKLRTAVTDDQGRYKIVDLLPGTYTVTFTLTGWLLQDTCLCHVGLTGQLAPEASQIRYYHDPNYLLQAKWNFVATKADHGPRHPPLPSA